MMDFFRKTIFLLLLLMVISQNLLANAGSPMVWFSFFHLIFINAFIGLAESEILKRLNIENEIKWIIGANYVSMFLGMYFIAPYFTSQIGYDDFFGNQTSYGNYDLKMFFIGMLIAFIATLIIEFPFYYIGINKAQRSETIKGLLIANLATYFLMTLIYFLIVRKGAHF